MCLFTSIIIIEGKGERGWFSVGTSKVVVVVAAMVPSSYFVCVCVCDGEVIRELNMGRGGT